MNREELKEKTFNEYVCILNKSKQLEKELKQTKLNFKNSQTHSKNCYKKLKEKFERVKEVYHRNYELIQENGKLKQENQELKVNYESLKKDYWELDKIEEGILGKFLVQGQVISAIQDEIVKKIETETIYEDVSPLCEVTISINKEIFDMLFEKKEVFESDR